MAKESLIRPRLAPCCGIFINYFDVLDYSRMYSTVERMEPLPAHMTSYNSVQAPIAKHLPPPPRCCAPPPNQPDPGQRSVRLRRLRGGRAQLPQHRPGQGGRLEGQRLQRGRLRPRAVAAGEVYGQGARAHAGGGAPPRGTEGRRCRRWGGHRSRACGGGGGGQGLLDRGKVGEAHGEARLLLVERVWGLVPVCFAAGDDILCMRFWCPARSDWR